MAIKALNSVAGFSIGETPTVIILSNGDISTNNFISTGTSNLNAIGNIFISGGSNGQVLTTNGSGGLSFSTIDTAVLSNGTSNVKVYANGNVAISSAGNANIFIVTGTGANVVGTLDVTDNLTTGNAYANSGTFGANLVAANFANVASNLITSNATVNLEFAGNTANFSGNVIVPNLTVNLSLSGNTANFSGNVVVPNLGVNLELSGNTANFSGNVVVPNLSVNLALSGNTANFSGNVVVSNLGVNLELSGNTANFTGNVSALNASLGNLATANFVNVSSNLYVTDTANVGNLRTDNLLYANGSPWDLQEAAGANTEIQFNDGSNNFGASANFTFNDTTQTLTVTGNANVSALNVSGNSDLGNIGNVKITGGSVNYVIVTDGAGNLSWGSPTGSLLANGTSNVNIPAANGNVNISAAGVANVLVVTGTGANVAGTLDVTGNLTVSNAYANAGTFGANLIVANFANVASNTITNNLTVNLELAGNTANFSGNVVVPNLGVNLELAGNTANFSGNVSALNANLGNLATANFANIASNLTTSNATVNLELAGNTANFSGNVVVSNLGVNLELAGNTANFSGNIVALNANLGNAATANFVLTGEIQNGSSNIVLVNNGNIAFSPNISNVMVVSNVGANIVGYVSANGNGTFGAVYSNTVTSQGGNLTLYSEQAGNSNVILVPHGNGTVDVSNVRITSVAEPFASTDAATKAYVDAAVTGIHVHAACLVGTTGTLAVASTGTTSYVVPGPGQIGAYISTTGTFYLIDGGNVQTVGTRILVKNEANAAWNGIYTYANTTALVRASDFDTSADAAGGDFTFIQTGSTLADTGWIMTSDGVVLGTDPVVWTQFSGAGTYQAGAGLTLTGSVFSVNVDGITTEISGGNVVVKANAQFTTPNIDSATGTSLNLTGNLLAGNVNSNTKITTVDFEASGNIIAANISANANLIVNNATVNLALSGNTANFSGNVILPNLTVNLELSGNTANFTGNIVTLNANLGNLATANYVNVAQQVNGNIANFSGNLTAANASLGNLATANYFTGVLINGTSNAQIDGVNGNFNVSVGGNANVLQVTASSANIVGTANVTGSANISERINLGNTTVNTIVTWGSVTTTAITANQTIASFSKTGVTGVEFLVKGIDATGSKYSVATVQAVTDGTNVDFSTFAGVNLGSTTGSLAVNIDGSNIALQVSPTSSNSTVWTTQFRLI